jgi:hypothetical protein
VVEKPIENRKGLPVAGRLQEFPMRSASRPFAAQQHFLDHSLEINGLFLPGSGALDGHERLASLAPKLGLSVLVNRILVEGNVRA